MADEQVSGLPEGTIVRPIQQPTPASSDPSQVEGLPEGSTLRSVTPPAPKPAVVSAPKTTVMPKATAPSPTVPSAHVPTAAEKHDEPIAHQVGEYGKGLASSLGVPTSKEELESARESQDITKHPVKVAAETLGGPAVQAGEQVYGILKGLGKGIVQTGREAYEAGENIAQGQPVLRNLAKPASEALNTIVGAVPFIGGPMVEAGQDIATGNKARAAGELTGVLGQVAVPELHEELFPDKTLKFHEQQVAAAQRKFDTVNKKAAPYADSMRQGIAPPKEVNKQLKKAQAKLDEAVAHRDIYKEEQAKRVAAARAPKPAPAPEIPAEKIEAAPALRKLGTKEPPIKPIAMPEATPEAKPASKEVPAPETKPTTALETKEAPVAEKSALPKEESTGYAAKKEEIVPAGAEGREPVTPAAEYHPEVRQRVFELSNENLKKLAQAHGIDPEAPEYAFGKGVKRTEATETSSGRQQPGRAKLADDIMAQMTDDEKINIGRNARDMEETGKFKGQDLANTKRAEQAEKLFPRLRGPVDEFGNPPARGGSQAVTEEPGFNRWFGKSTVIDEKGQPLQVYHGTRASTIFNPEEMSTEGPPVNEEGEPTTSGSGPDPTAYMGAHFAKEASVANKFAEGQGWMRSHYESGEKAPRVIPTYLKLENPKDFGNESNLRDFIYQGRLTGYAGDELLDHAMAADKIEPETPDADEWLHKYDSDPKFRAEQNQWLFEHANVPASDEVPGALEEGAQELAMQAKANLKEQGHDGVIYKNQVEGGTGYMVFDSRQIKSSLSGKSELPTVSGGSQEASAPAKETVGTAEGAKADTEYFVKAKEELGPNALITNIIKRAQEMKDAAKYAGPERRSVKTPEMAYTGPERRNPFKDTEGAKETIARDTEMPKHPSETAKETSKHSYEYSKQGDIHTVTARDPEGNSTAIVTATAEDDDPRTWTVRASYSEKTGKGIGERSYMRLAEAARSEANRSGKPITLQGDKEMSPAAKRTWEKLENDRNYDVKWKEGRPSIHFTPEEESEEQ